MSVLPLMKVATVLILPSPPCPGMVSELTGAREKVPHFPSVPSPCLALSQCLFFRVPAPSRLLLFLRVGEAIFCWVLQYYHTTRHLSLGSVSTVMQDSLWLSHVSEASSQEHCGRKHLRACHLSVHTPMAAILSGALVMENPLPEFVAKCSA